MLCCLEQKADEVVVRPNLQLAFLNEMNNCFPGFNCNVLRLENGKRCLHPQNPPFTKELNFVKVQFEQLTVQLFSQRNIAIPIRNAEALGKYWDAGFWCVDGATIRAKNRCIRSVGRHADILHNHETSHNC